jgi:hypothetical protein
MLLAGVTFFVTMSTGAPSASPTPLPLYAFVNSGVGPLPWDAVSLASTVNNAPLIGTPHAASASSQGVLAFRTTGDHLGLYTQPVSGAPTYRDLTVGHDVPALTGEPVPFFDPSGAVDVLYIDANGHLELVSGNDTASDTWPLTHGGEPWTDFITTDLSALSATASVTGVPSIRVFGQNALIAMRTTSGSLQLLSLNFSGSDPVPTVSATQTVAPAIQVGHAATTTTSTSTTSTTSSTTSTTTTSTTTSTTSTTSTTTTTVPPPPSSFGSDPVVLDTPAPSIAVLSPTGHLLQLKFSSDLTTSVLWDVTVGLNAPRLVAPLTTASSSTLVAVAGVSLTGNAVVYQISRQSVLPNAGFRGWTNANATNLSPGAPPMTGTLGLALTPTTITLAGQAASWGDLYVLTNTLGSSSWTNTDVSATGGTAAHTVGPGVAAMTSGSTTVLYAGGVASPPLQGTGLYAIPSKKWPTAISDGWPVISETGALGTLSKPWVGYTRSIPLTQTADFLMGQAIQNSHRRVTWLSFWTVSGPLSGEVVAPATYYQHGFASGAWVAAQIAQYRANGVGLKPDWVIFDPEGWPDAHSGLDAPSGSSAATMAKYATYWTQFLQGWSDGLASVDPSLKPGVYASQSEYRNYNLITTTMPVFEAIAFRYNGPIRIAGAWGPNVRGYIAFNATCKPQTTLTPPALNQPYTLAQEISLLQNPPWSGQFNTLQFDAGVYCPPPA